MFEWLKKNKLSHYGIRPAEFDDISFVMEGLISGSEAGHFTPTLMELKHQKIQKIMFENLLKGIGTPTFTGEEIVKKSGVLWVYGNDRVGNIGFIFLQEKYQGSGNSDIEILMAGISQEYRKKGHGFNMINCLLQAISNSTSLYARCYKESEGMFQLLQKVGFVTINTKPSGTHELELKGKE